MSCVLALTVATASGCYLAHERPGPVVSDDAARSDAGHDAPAACLPDGDYTVPVRIESTTPAGCMMPMVMPVQLRLPLEPSSFAMMCSAPEGGVTSTGTCGYAVDVSCPVIDASVAIVGTVDTHAPAISGRLEIRLESLGGSCTAVLVLGG